MIAAAAITAVCLSAAPSVAFTPGALRVIQRMSPPPALPEDETNRVADDPAAAALGRLLFHDTRFSAGGAVSCATCHDPASGFDDGRALAQGEGQGTRNTPTLIGAPHQRWFFWDGRADSLWSQALHPFEHDAEFNASRTDAVRTLARSPDLAARYEAIFGPLPSVQDEARFPSQARPDTEVWANMQPADQHALTEAFVNMGKSIAAFERTIPMGTSRFDEFVAALPDTSAGGLTQQELRGLSLFIGEAGCRNCHGGPLFTDRAFHNIGLPEPDGAFPSDPGRSAGLDLARAHEFRLDGPWSDAPASASARRVTRAKAGPEHWGAFRTPTLRNLPSTGPYMHDGRFETLGEVLGFYNTLEDQVQLDHHQEQVLKPLNLSDQDLAALEAFLRTLQDTQPAKKAPTAG